MDKRNILWTLIKLVSLETARIAPGPAIVSNLIMKGRFVATAHLRIANTAGAANGSLQEAALQHVRIIPKASLGRSLRS